jgi:hypothetical protein
MTLLIIGTLAAGLFAGAAIYINAVEHPARVSCGIDVALAEFGPSYRRATVMQASLAIGGCLSGLTGGWLEGDTAAMTAGLLLGAVVPFTLIVILPTNRRLLHPGLRDRAADASALLSRWNRLHAIRSLLATIAFVILLIRIAA